MNLERIISSIKKKKYLMISEPELNELLSQSKMISEEDTYISDKIRLFEFEDDLIIQEKTTKDEYLLRVMKTKKKLKSLSKKDWIYTTGCGMAAVVKLIITSRFAHQF